MKFGWDLTRQYFVEGEGCIVEGSSNLRNKEKAKECRSCLKDIYYYYDLDWVGQLEEYRITRRGQDLYWFKQISFVLYGEVKGFRKWKKEISFLNDNNQVGVAKYSFERAEEGNFVEKLS